MEPQPPADSLTQRLRGARRSRMNDAILQEKAIEEREAAPTPPTSIPGADFLDQAGGCSRSWAGSARGLWRRPFEWREPHQPDGRGRHAELHAHRRRRVRHRDRARHAEPGHAGAVRGRELPAVDAGAGGDQGDRAGPDGAGAGRPLGRGHGRRARVDEGDRADRRAGSGRAQAVPLPGRDARAGLRHHVPHHDAAHRHAGAHGRLPRGLGSRTAWTSASSSRPPSTRCASRT